MKLICGCGNEVKFKQSRLGAKPTNEDLFKLYADYDSCVTVECKKCGKKIGVIS